MARAGTRAGGERGPRLAGDAAADRRGRAVHDPALAAAIYGQIVTTGTVAAVAVDDALPAGDVLATVAASVLVLWTAHLYAEALAHGGVTHARAVVGRFRWPIAETAIPTLVVLALAALGVISRQAAVITAEAFGAVVLFGLVAVVARRSGASRLKTLLFATLGAALGLAIAVVKSAVH
jgi:hypothetical protein